jgi:hypothetical protein
MSLRMQLIRSRGDDELATRCTFFSLRSGRRKKEFFACGERAKRTGKSFALEPGYDEQGTANSHDIFKRGNHQVGNFEDLH